MILHEPSIGTSAKSRRFEQVTLKVLGSEEANKRLVILDADLCFGGHVEETEMKAGGSAAPSPHLLI